MDKPNRRWRIRLREIVVVVVILGTLVLLLLPSVECAREAARRNGCMCNLKQLALATLNLESATQRFPVSTDYPGTYSQTNPGAAEGMNLTALSIDADPLNAPVVAGYSWVVKIMPYMEEADIYQEMQKTSNGFQAEAFSSANTFPATGQATARPFWSIRIPALRCPSFAGADDATRGALGPPPYPSTAALGNYVCMAGTHLVPAVENIAGRVEENGIVISRFANQGELKGLRATEIRDGTSKTVLYTESREKRLASWFCGQSTWVVGLRSENPSLVMAQSREQGIDGVIGPISGKVALGYGPGKPGTTTAKNYYIAEATAPIFSKDGKGREWGPSSQHAGGVVVHIFADCHVKAISESVAPHIYHHAITRSGNDPLNDADL
ncbi:MAG: DUF1559 domain-containing protein [Planctomycetota bacterium]|nr:DUF1559 domain-containing protein [Planctomycetota bacterium]MDA1179309.1 DUF1559 domain-containing protein [Planctomycetota bacterium]